MPVDFLTAEQRARYGRFSGEPSAAQLSRYFYFESNDRAFIRRQRGAHNRLGIALLLGTVRFLGTFSPDLGAIPIGVRRYVAQQLHVDGEICRQYLEQTRRRHVAEICREYGYREFSAQPDSWRLLRWLYARAWTCNDRPSVLFDLTTARLLENKIVLPGVSTLERLVAAVRERTAQRLWRHLSESVDDQTCAKLESLLTVPIDSRHSPFDQLRRPPTNPRVAGLLDALDRLKQVQALGMDKIPLGNVPRSRLQALARHANTTRAAALARMPHERRLAILVAFAADLSVTAVDDAVTLFDEVMGSLLGRVERANKRDRMRTLKALNAAALVLRQACATLLTQTEVAGATEAVFAAVPRSELQAAVDRVGELAEATNSQALERLLTRYAHVRRFLPYLLAQVPFAGGEAAEPVLAGLAFIRTCEGRRVIMQDETPAAVVTRSWRPLVFADADRLDKRAYTFCVLDKLRRGLRRHDIYVPGSRRWADPRAQLLSEAVMRGRARAARHAER